MLTLHEVRKLADRSTHPGQLIGLGLHKRARTASLTGADGLHGFTHSSPSLPTPLLCIIIYGALQAE